ncbi:Translation factor guf1 mitochondrial [Tulasnella sp. 331]|nr:Translation factor guf1 mitochondrial [Tulasnella sp. 331]KAG8889737.1 Translation factor guf1 mitochondrial [Tulasnella sp. 332]
MVRSAASTARRVNFNDASAKNKAASCVQDPLDVEDVDKIEDEGSDEEDSNSAQAQLQAMLQAVEKPGKAKSHTSALNKKITSFHEAALEDLAKKQDESRIMFEHMDQHIASDKAEQAEADWQVVATSFGNRAKDIRDLVASFDEVLEANGPKREIAVESISAGVEKTLQERAKSRKLLMRKARDHLERGRSHQKDVTDAQALIKATKQMILVARNFGIIAHIDHGKSTLADRLLEMTGTIGKNASENKQVLDKLKVERERGITVKAQSASMLATYRKNTFLLNLIDTPGHVDFSWEVLRSLTACQGALLLVDASQGIQAQTLSVYHAAKERGVTIIPVLNKIDLPAADPERIAVQLSATFDIDPQDILHVSAKTGVGVESVLQAIIERIPPPLASRDGPLKALLFDSMYDRYRGAISLFSVQQGILNKGDKIASCHTGKRYDVTEIGVMNPEETPTGSLYAGQVGYVACNMKQSSEAHIGDTFFRVGQPVEPLAGFKASKAMVYAGVFPIDASDFPKLEESIARLTLTDRSVSVQRESSTALGQGCRLGFLGTLHMDVFRQRLEDEYDASVIITSPSVPYEVLLRGGKIKLVSNPVDFPDPHDGKVLEVREPMVKATIIVPDEYLGDMMDLISSHRGTEIEHKYLDAGSRASRVMLQSVIPLSEVVTDFFDQLKHRSSGFASFDYEDAGYVASDLSKMMFQLNSKPIDALAMVVHRSNVAKVGRVWTKKLKEVVPRQLFEVAIQATIGSKVQARETISAIRKDVTAGLYGGHYERKLKHLERQKESKKKMKRVGNIQLPQEAFYDILRTKQSD